MYRRFWAEMYEAVRVIDNGAARLPSFVKQCCLSDMVFTPDSTLQNCVSDTKSVQIRPI